MSQLHTDCLYKIFEDLEDDKVTLRSCLLVNRLWCEVSVRILWREIRNYNTLIACLPNESKEILSKNGIITSTLAAPTFNYASFCKILSVFHVHNEIGKFLKNQQQNLRDTVTREIYKMLMNQISSLKNLELYCSPLNNINKNIPKFTSFPGANECLKNLSELSCYSNNNPELLYQISQICRNIQSLNIELKKVNSIELTNLISVQQNLKH